MSNAEKLARLWLQTNLEERHTFITLIGGESGWNFILDKWPEIRAVPMKKDLPPHENTLEQP